MLIRTLFGDFRMPDARPTRMQMVVRQFREAGLTHLEIGQRLCITENASKKRISRMHRRLGIVLPPGRPTRDRFELLGGRDRIY